MYIYESHMGGLYNSVEELDYDYLYCDTCGDSDHLIGVANNRKEAEELLKSQYSQEYIDEFLNEAFGEKEISKYPPVYLDDKNIKLNSNQVNANIKGHILSTKEMRNIGFTDYYKKNWYYSKMIQFPKEKRYSGFDISFCVSIPKNGDDINIMVLDEAFCQPYDYQAMLLNDPTFEPAIIVYNQVEQFMEYLQDKRVISGHIKGKYI